MKICEQVQQILAENDVKDFEKVLSDQFLQHIKECAECSDYYAAIKILEREFNQLPEHSPDDELVKNTLAQVLRAQTPSSVQQNKSVMPRAQQWASTLAAGFVFLAVLVIWDGLPTFDAPAPVPVQTQTTTERGKPSYDFYTILSSADDKSSRDATGGRIGDQAMPAEFEPEPIAEASAPTAEEDERKDDGAVDYARARAEQEQKQQDLKAKLKEERMQSAEMMERIAKLEARKSQARERSIKKSPEPKPAPKAMTKPLTTKEYSKRNEELAKPGLLQLPEQLNEMANTSSNDIQSKDDRGVRGAAIGSEEQMLPDVKQERFLGNKTLLKDLDIPAVADRSEGSRSRQYGRKQMNKKGTFASGSGKVMNNVSDPVTGYAQINTGSAVSPQEPTELSVRNDISYPAISFIGTSPDAAAQPLPYPQTMAPEPIEAEQVAAGFSQRPVSDIAEKETAKLLVELNNTQGLEFKEATGYWANTYVPGDAQVRALRSRLQQWDRSNIKSVAGIYGELEQQFSQNKLPFDPPTNAALAVYLQADKNSIQSPTRMKLQVGLQATERFSGQRPAMNVGVIVDVSDKSDKQLAAKVKSLLAALVKAKQPGDRFSLVVAGNNGGKWIGHDEFRHGPVQVAINRLFDEKQKVDSRLSIVEALQLATKLVRKHDDPTAVLGSSSILLISSADLTSSVQSLEMISHQNAVNGITMSVFPLGDSIEMMDVDRLVLSGQGQRRILSSTHEAEQLIGKELLSSSRAVARAVRLRIRLAKGVKLVNVYDSSRLDEVKSEQVRQAEKSIDQRLARNFAIKADRGDDEEGIQIVIPSFYAGDSHIVMLDVVATQPGPVADVTVRYKDLLYLNNGVARNNLSVGSVNTALGPLQHNVVKNVLAIKLAQSIRTASHAVARQQYQAAYAELSQINQLYQTMRKRISAWHNDPELLHDERLLQQYMAILNSSINSKDVPFIADSMLYAGHRKLFSHNE